MSLFYDPVISRPPTFPARFRRKFCDLYASIYGAYQSTLALIFVKTIVIKLTPHVNDMVDRGCN